MTLTEFLQNRFRGDIRFRGAAYVSAERVSITRVTPDHVAAVVRDGTEFETQLSRDDGELKMYCNCDAGSQPDAGCKHLWATILAVDEGGYVQGSVGPGHIPPFASEIPQPVDFHDPDEYLSGDAPFRSGRRTGRRKGLEVQPRLKSWEQQLQQLRAEMESDDVAAAVALHDRQIFYEIDATESRSEKQLVLQTSHRQRRASGQWGKRKPLRLRPGRFDEIERQDDRTILAYLSGATPERTNWYAQRAELQTRVHRYRVPYELCELILPMMCGTGRVSLLDESGQSLVWDDGPAWELSLCVVDTGDRGWQLRGMLQRGGESQPADQADLLLPGGLVIWNGAISRLDDFGAFAWVTQFNEADPLVVPAGDEHELVNHLFDMPVLPRLELPAELKLEEVTCEPVPCLTVRSPQGTRWRLERLQGDVTFEYLGTSIRGSSQQWAIVQRDQGRCVLRNRPREAECFATLQDFGFRRLSGRGDDTHDVEISVRDLGPAVRELIARGWQVRADGKQVRQPEPLQFRIRSGIDWFELHADVDFEGHTIKFPDLLAALLRGDSTVRLDDGSLGILPEDWTDRYGVLAGLGATDEDHLRFTHNQAALLDALLAARETIDYDQEFMELRDKLRSFTGIEAVSEPKGFQGTLRNYQRDGLGWLAFLQEFGFGGCLADDMGLGKTVQVLAQLLARRRTGKKGSAEGGPSLVVVPKSLMFNWRQECNRFAPKLKVLEYAGLDREPLRKDFVKQDVVLTTYGTLRRDIMALKDVPFDYVILDEAQTIKNAGSQTAKATRLLRSRHRVALSGTPIENHLGDLWSIFEFLNPGMLGRSSVFKTYATDSTEESRQLLARGLSPFMLRRTKRQVASELPDKFEQTIRCNMGKRQTELYDELRDHYRNSLLGLVEKQGLAKSKMHVLEALLRLRQAACHPALLDKTAADESSAKLDVLRAHLEQLLDEDHKALVFSQFTSMLAIVKKHLDKHGIVYEYLDGQTKNRRECVERFQNDPGCGVFLISLKAGGLGLNLTAADYVYLLDPWWNPAVESQAIDRAHRVGQNRQVFAYRLICRGTVEEKIAELQTTKRKLAEAILESDQRVLKDLSVEDLEMLLT